MKGVQLLLVKDEVQASRNKDLRMLQMEARDHLKWEESELVLITNRLQLGRFLLAKGPNAIKVLSMLEHWY